MELVSIIMPSFNAGKTIYESINSVLVQSYKDWELLVIDDFSTDNTRDVIQSFEDARIHYHCLTANSGSPAAPRNFGLDLAKGKYIAFLDSDDLWTKNKLDLQIGFMKNNNFAFTCTAYNVMDINGKVLSSYSPPRRVDYNQLLINNSIGCLTAVVERELLNDLRFPVCGHEDFALWLKLIKQSEFVYSIDDKLAFYRKLENSVSSNKNKLVWFFLNIYRNEEGFGMFKSLYLALRYFINVVWFKYP